ncbi:MAG: hypothetical protein ACYDIA_21970 [Candidatus Humimicrobiaceae bacterium]
MNIIETKKPIKIIKIRTIGMSLFHCSQIFESHEGSVLKKYKNDWDFIASATMPDSEVVIIKAGRYKIKENNTVLITPIKRFLNNGKFDLMFFSLKMTESKSHATATPKEYRKVGIVKNPKAEKNENSNQPNLLLEVIKYLEIIIIRINKKQRRVYPMAFVEYSISGDETAAKPDARIAVFLL